jgi:hypothetical protein
LFLLKRKGLAIDFERLHRAKNDPTYSTGFSTGFSTGGHGVSFQMDVRSPWQSIHTSPCGSR